jgi:hypothetical protein
VYFDLGDKPAALERIGARRRSILTPGPVKDVN